MDPLKDIVQRMIDAGETEENIALVIKQYNLDEPKINKQESSKQSPTETDTAVEEVEIVSDSPSKSSDTESVSKDKKQMYGLEGMSPMAKFATKQFSKLLGVEDQISSPKNDEEFADASFIDETAKSVKSVSLGIEGMIKNLPNHVNEIAVATGRAIETAIEIWSGDMLTGEKGEGFFPSDQFDAFDKLDKDTQDRIMQLTGASSGMPGQVIFQKLAEKSSELSEKAMVESEKIAETKIKFETSIGEDVTNGNFGQASFRAISEAVGSIPFMAEAMIPVVGIPLIVAQESGRAVSEKRKEGEAITPSLISYGAVVGMSEGLLEVVTRDIGRTALKGLLGSSKEVIKKGVTELALQFAKSSGAEGLSEGATETINTIADAIYTDGTSAATSEKFDGFLSRLVDTMIIGTVSGGGMSGAGIGVQVVRQGVQAKNVNKDVEESNYNNLVDAFADPEIDEGSMNLSQNKYTEKFLNYELDQKLSKGEITTEESEKIKNNFRRTQGVVNVLNKINIKGIEKAKAADLLREKIELELKIKEVNEPSLTKNEKTRVEEINSELGVLQDQVQEALLKKDIKFTEKGAAAMGIATEILDANTGDSKKDKATQKRIDELFVEDEVDSKTGKKTGKKIKVEAGGVYDSVENKIYIDKVAAAKLRLPTVGSHELLHGILANAAIVDSKILKDFKKQLSKEQIDLIDGKLKAAYDTDYIKNNPDEFITQFSDAIAAGEIKYNESLFTKLKDIIEPVFKAVGYSNINFESGKGLYNFMRTYSKSMESGSINRDIINKIKNKTKQKTTGKNSFSKKVPTKNTLFEGIQELVPSTIKTEKEYNKYINSPDGVKLFNSIILPTGAIQRYVRDNQTSQEQGDKTLQNIQDRILKFNPQATRKTDGKVVGIEAFTERVMSDAMFGKMDANKSLAKESERASKEESIDNPDVNTQLADDVNIDSKIDNTPKQQTSKLRRDLGIKQGDDIYNSVKQTAKEIFGKDLDAVDLKKLKSIVNKKARSSDIFKDVAKLMGTEKAIDQQFLNKNILKIIDNLPVSDLVKLERGVKGEKIFTKGKKLTQVGPIDKAIAEGKLPKNTNRYSQPTVWTKLPVTLDQAKQFFTQKRKAGLVGVIAENLISDAAPSVTKEIKTPPKRRAEVLDVIDRDPELKFSKGSLSPEQLSLVESKSSEILSRWFAETAGQKKGAVGQRKAMELVLSDILKDTNIPSIAILGYAKELAKPAQKFIDNLDKELVVKKDFIGIANEQIEQALSAITIKKLLALDQNPGQAFDFVNEKGVKIHLNEFRKLQKGYQLQQIKNLGTLKGIINILKFHKDYHTTAGKIGDGRYQGYAGSKDWFDSINESLENQGVEIIFKETGSGFVPVNIEINGKKQFENSKELKDKIKTFSQSNNLTENTVTKEYTERKKEAGEGFDAMVDYLDYIKKNGSKLQFGMSLMALKSNMSALGKRVAYVKYFFKGNSDSKTVFEHMLPSLYTAKQMIENFYGKGVNLKQLKESQQVAMIPRDMDKRINIVHMDSMPSWFNLGMDPLSRYYNTLTKGFRNMFALEAIGGKDKGTVYGTEYLALNNSILKASKLNNALLPSGSELTGDFINNEVLNEMTELDNENVIQEKKFSKAADLSKGMNDIIQAKTGIASEKTYSQVKAQVVGASKGRFDFFIPPSAEDFVGLLYKTLGKGKLGNDQMAWYKAHLLNPFARAMDNISRDRVALMNDFKALKKQLNAVPKTLRKKVPGENFTQEQAIRAYIWNKQGMSIPGMSQTDLKSLNDFVSSNAELIVFADQLIAMQKGDQYAAPSEGWIAGNIVTDLMEGINTTKRSKYLEVWQQNADQIFSEANLNKLEAAYGKKYRVALENSLQRMKTGKNRSFGGDTLTGRVTDWLTNSIGAIMFFNTRSAVLQTISAINFINFKDNNIFAAGKAFANQPQYWKDFKTLFNSDFLVERRDGLKLNVNEADIAEMAKKDGVKGVISELLRLGFLPTQLADSFAIASGGSTFYRNRIKALEKQGMSKTEAETQAFQDFRETAEESQQSSRPDRISQQQAGPLGRIILAFANTPAQYARLIKKAASDLKNGRGDAKTNVSKILYYGIAQNLVFNALQQALFGLAFGDEEEEEEKEKRYVNVANGMSDSLLRGMGLGGAIFSVLKNTALRLNQESDKKSPKYQDVLQKELAQISPPISSKLSKLKAAGRSYSWNKKEMMEKGWSIDNPAYLAAGQVIAATTNIPLDRAFKKIDNLRNSSNSDLEAWQRVASAAGWSAWELGIQEPKSKKSSRGKQRKTSTRSSGRKTIIRK